MTSKGNILYINDLPGQEIHVGACGRTGWPVYLVPNAALDDVSLIENARLNVKRPDGQHVYWPLIIADNNPLRRYAEYKFRGANVDQDPPDLYGPGYFIGVVEVDIGDRNASGGTVWYRCSRNMALKVSPNQ